MKINLFRRLSLVLFTCITILFNSQPDVFAQTSSSSHINWIRPKSSTSPAKWGIKGGIVFSLWPTPVGSFQQGSVGGPRGLIRIGYNFDGNTYLINFIAIEPVVGGKQEFSEISPSRLDGRLGKFIWAGSTQKQTKFMPFAITRGKITHPDQKNPNIEQLTVYLFIEKYLNGAHPYLKVTIRSDQPDEIGFQIFNRKDSALMQRCALTATMGNYSRLRLLYLKNRLVNSRKLYKGFNGINFIEKKPFAANQLKRDKNGNYIVFASSNESFTELAAWPQDSIYLSRSYIHWRYRPPFKVTQYWRKKPDKLDSTLRVRVNGRAKYWAGGSNNQADYINVPGGVAFENFEMRERYYSGQKFYFGITRKTPEELKENLP